jgi:hypothetical protein
MIQKLNYYPFYHFLDTKLLKKPILQVSKVQISMPVEASMTYMCVQKPDFPQLKDNNEESEIILFLI